MLTDRMESATLDEIFAYSDNHQLPHHVSAARLQSPHTAKASIWPDVKEFKTAAKIESPDLCVSERGDILTEIAKGIDGYLQFPRSTIYLHAIGCVAVAMCKEFSIEYGISKMPVNLYVLTGQPPSTGKSEVNNRLVTPILKAYKQENLKTDTERRRLNREIKKLERSLDKKNIDHFDEMEIIDKIESKQRRLKEIPEWSPIHTNATIEAIESSLHHNDGMFNIVSAEAEAINVVTGITYGDKSSKSNFELLLKGFDGEWYSSMRISRDGYSGDVRGSICVIAQDDTIDSMLSAGASGRGLTERFLMLNEKTRLGTRDHSVKYHFDKSMYSRYEQMIANVISDKDVTLNFTLEAEELISYIKKKLEPTMADGAIHSSNLMTGFIGKADKQIRKIAAVLHVSEQWQDGSDRKRTIEQETAAQAGYLFESLAKTFVNAADYHGYSGINSEIEKLCNVVTNLAQKNRLRIPINMLRDNIKAVKPFKGIRNLQSHLKTILIPELESLNYCVLEGQTLIINPRLK